MSEMSEKARAAAKDKAERLARSDPHARVDASGYAPDGALDGDVQTGPRPISRRQFRRGGTVAGETPAPRADRKRRASGGLTADSLVNRDVKAANEERTGTKHIGGLARGGRAEAMAKRVHKLIGGALTPQQKLAMTRRPVAIARADGGKVHKDEAQDRKLIHEMGCKCGKCSGGRVERAAGGRNSSFFADEYGNLHGEPKVYGPGNPKGGFQDHFNRLAQRSQSGDKKATAVLDRWTDKTRKPRASGGKLTAEARKHIKAKNFAGPDRSYPIENESHARDALARSSGKPVHAEVERKVHQKYPGMQIAKKSGGSVRGPAINDGTRPTGGRLARKGGGRAKKGTNVNIIIAPQGAGAAPPRPMQPAPPASAANPVGLHQGAPPMPPPGVMPPGVPMRARGGRTYPIDAGAGSGLGRLEKAQRASRS